ncbi:MAG: HPr(Ser) kinase/phosphatase [Chthoniobacterales bacterium]|nr:HPr(Ser) kinase/phosphatase [Chthoniobacterales bacterium]
MPAAPKTNPVSVGDFFGQHAGKLGLELVAGRRGLQRLIREPTVNRPGLALTDFYSYFAPKRVQVFGGAELSYLQGLPAKIRIERLQRFLDTTIPCLVVARHAAVPRDIIRLAGKAGIPVFRTPMITMKFINAATIALEADFAPRRSEHGSMVDILGVGTLIRGASGIGKSECVLSLLERGYSLVSDDITRFRAFEGRELIGSSAELTRFHMEVRGIGIINVAAIFGVRSIRTEKSLDLVVTLKDWQEMEDIDRHGLQRQFYKILGISIPHVIIPVRMGRDLGHLVEVAALDHKLKSHGIDSALEFNERLIRMMETKT